MITLAMITLAIIGIWAWHELGIIELRQKAREPQKPETPISRKIRTFHILTEKADRCRDLGEIGLANYYERQAGEIYQQLRHINPTFADMALTKEVRR